MRYDWAIGSIRYCDPVTKYRCEFEGALWKLRPWNLVDGKLGSQRVCRERVDCIVGNWIWLLVDHCCMVYDLRSGRTTEDAIQSDLVEHDIPDG